MQKVFIGRSRKYQLRVGMDGERDLEFIPVHTSAYAQRLPLKQGHATVEEAHRERDALVEWLRKETLTA